MSDDLLSRVRSGLSRTVGRLDTGLSGLLTGRKIDQEMLEELEDILIQSDFGIEVARQLREKLEQDRVDREADARAVRKILAGHVEAILRGAAPRHIDDLIRAPASKPHVVMIVGVNGSGKTTSIAKLANYYKQRNLRVLLAAGDTFRAAAIEQLKIWGDRLGIPTVAGREGKDSASVAYDALGQAQESECDLLILDTAGRMHNKGHLMDELEKLTRVMRKRDLKAPHDCWIILDATTGQNALRQIEAFQKAAPLTGVIMTKLDGTARGGVLVAAVQRFALPILATGLGEGMEDLIPFDPTHFSQGLFLT